MTEKKNLNVLLNELNEIEELKLNKINEIKESLNKLPIDNNLIFFYGEHCSFTKKVQNEVNCLEIHLNKQINKKEVWNNIENQKLYQEVGGLNSCGGVPFFYNKNTGKSICGATSCDILKIWADSSLSTNSNSNSNSSNSST